MKMYRRESVTQAGGGGGPLQPHRRNVAGVQQGEIRKSEMLCATLNQGFNLPQGERVNGVKLFVMGLPLPGALKQI